MLLQYGVDIKVDLRTADQSVETRHIRAFVLAESGRAAEAMVLRSDWVAGILDVPGDSIVGFELEAGALDGIPLPSAPAVMFAYDRSLSRALFPGAYRAMRGPSAE